MSLGWSVNRFGEPYLYEINRVRFIAEPSVEQFDSFFGGQLKAEGQLSIIVGSDSGLLIPYIESFIDLNRRSRYLIIEDEMVLAEIRDKINIQSDRIKLISIDQWEEGGEAIGLKRFVFTNKITLLKSLGCDDGHYEPYAELFEKTNSLYAKDKLLIEASSIGMKHFVMLQLLNSPDHVYQACELESYLAERDVLILAAGPSLDQLGDWLLVNRENFTLLAVTRIAPFLQKLGIKPDFYVAVDPQEISFDISRAALSDSAEVPLIAANHTHFQLVSNWCSRVYMLDKRLPWDSPLNVQNWSQSAPTVTHSAIAVAVQAGAKRIFLGGVDLCFDKDMKSHVSGTPEAKAGPKLNVYTYPVETYAGEMAETDRHMLLSIQFAEQLAEDARLKSIPIYNLSQQAAAAKGIEFINKDSITGLQSNYPAVQQVQGNEQVNRRAYLEAIKGELESFYDVMVGLEKELKERSLLVGKLFSQQDILNTKVWQRIKDIDSLLGQLGESRKRFFTIWGFGYFFNALDGKDADSISAKDLKEYFKGDYANHLQIAAELKKTLKFALDKCNRRLDELAPDDLDRLASEWEQELEFFRPEIVAGYVPSLRGSAKLEKIKQHLFEQYGMLSKKIDERESARYHLFNNEGALITRALELFKRGSVELLGRLGDIVISENSKNKKYSSALLSLINGYKFELEKKPMDALVEYEKVIDKGGRPCLIPALKRVLVLSNQQKDYVQSLQAIECISLLDPSYLKIYAEFLLKLGSVHEALDKFADYNQAFPGDIDVLARIAEVYHETGNIDQAEEMITSLLALYPEHQSVLTVAAKISQKRSSEAGA
ncbi:6-hydroxymethylpterin diphosphokinase MptE-like protein [Nitrincola sp. MINF-07-Sa-05]|uniref:6-hydroxymethylpterin diphosphokinase MptE-like protein n=1 Tax=Nitrincola salilacus TaxID=3400273 RepID=UPI003917F9A3